MKSLLSVHLERLKAISAYRDQGLTLAQALQETGIKKGTYINAARRVCEWSEDCGGWNFKKRLVNAMRRGYWPPTFRSDSDCAEWLREVGH